MKSNKKAMLESTLGKVVFGLVVIVVLLGIVMIFSGKLSGIWQSFMRMFRFGG